MSKIKQIAYMGLLLLLLPVSIVVASDQKPVKEGLAADKAQHIRGVSQTVLLAKKKAEPDPELQVLKQQIDILRDAVNSLDKPAGYVRGTKPSLETADEVQSNEAARAVEETRTKTQGNVRSVLVGIRAQKALIRTPSAKDMSDRAMVKQAAASKVEELVNAVEDALNSSPEQRAEKIAQLKVRLTPKRLAPIGEADAGEKTPTISTIVHHRRH